MVGHSTSRAAVFFGLLLLAGLAGCGGTDPADDPATAAQALPEDAPLVPADSSAFEAYMRSALTATPEPTLRIALDFDLAPVASFEGAEDGSGSFSTTNLQTRGVDEADTVRFDGEHLYVARPAALRYHWPTPEPRPLPLPPLVIEPGLLPADRVDATFLDPEIEVVEPAQVAIYAADDDPASATPVGALELPGPVEIRGLLTVPAEDGDPPLLVVVATENSWVTHGALDFWDPWYHSGGVVHVRVYDVTDPLDAQELLAWRYEGVPLATRRVGDRLILVGTFAPYLRTLAGVADPLEREALVAGAALEDLLPRSWPDDGEDAEPLVSPERCFVPVLEDDGSLRPELHRPTLATISTLDLRELAERVTVCAAGPVERILATTRSVYLASTDYRYPASTTVVHKFGLLDFGPRFLGSARVPGRPAGSQPSFGLGEHGDTLGILTSERVEDTGGGLRERNRLTLLREGTGALLRLVESAHLPSEEQPAAIGKPGEQVYGVRFVGDRVYVVTFRRIDPLYVIDIADPRAPFIAGELELPGFSDYLQPLGGELLLGVGMASVPSGDGFDWFQGVKVELFDVSNPSKPASLDVVEIGRRGSGTSARNDHQAVNWLDLGDGLYRVAVPVSVHDGPDVGDPTVWHPWSRTALQLFEVDAQARDLHHVGEVVAEEAGSDAPWTSTRGDRARIQGDALHYVHDTVVWSAPWSAPGEVVGPQ